MTNILAVTEEINLILFHNHAFLYTANIRTNHRLTKNICMLYNTVIKHYTEGWPGRRRRRRRSEGAGRRPQRRGGEAERSDCARATRNGGQAGRQSHEARNGGQRHCRAQSAGQSRQTQRRTERPGHPERKKQAPSYPYFQVISGWLSTPNRVFYSTPCYSWAVG